MNPTLPVASIARIEPRLADLGDGVLVRRTLPSRQQRMVGAWCFLDHAGPVQFAPGKGMHVGAHPHIGLQTFTWTLEGEVLHRDSLGNEQIIRPEQVNLMTAGYGVVHTEDSLTAGAPLHAAQLWIALPPEAEDTPPDFAHYPDLPQWQEAGATFTLVAGTYGNRQSPAHLYSPLVGLDIENKSATSATVGVMLNPNFEYAMLPLIGGVQIEGESFAADELAYLGQGRDTLTINLAAGAKVLLLGGEPFAQPVLMWWNFIGFSKTRIAEAQRQWASGDARFPQVADGQAPRLVAPPLPWANV